MPQLNDGFSDTDSDEDMEVLNKVCRSTGINPTDNPPSFAGASAASTDADSDGEGDDDLQFLRSIQERFAAVAPIDTADEPLRTLAPDWSDRENDGGLHMQVGPTMKVTPNSSADVERTGARNYVGTNDQTNGKEKAEAEEACCDGTDIYDIVDENRAGLPLKSSHSPNTTALAFRDAIKQNRSCQKLIRGKMMQVEARMEALDKLREHVKILKGFQVSCKRRTSRALSQKKDARAQLISLPKPRANEKKASPAYKGPSENAQVARYKEALETFAVDVKSKGWSKKENDNLVKGVKRQFQEMLLQQSFGAYDAAGNVDSIVASVKNIDITPDAIRLFLPRVNWEQLGDMYVPGRSGVECRARFLNFDVPAWNPVEDKKILHIVENKGLLNWMDIAATLGTDRTPFQCLTRFGRSLNVKVLNSKWSEDEDNRLRTAVETYGESNWQSVAFVVGRRTGTQCSNRWLKALHPTRKRVGRWTADEDKRLKISVTLFGPKTWKKIARYVPGRTQVQCRERWVNSLDPSVSTSKWTEEEDSKLKRAYEEHGCCWSKVAACIPRRTDNQCWRRWKVLFPNELPKLQAEKKIRKAALISNFVDRESERPALGPSDFRLQETNNTTGSKNVDFSRRKRGRPSKVCSEEVGRRKRGRPGKVCSEEVGRSNNGNANEDSQPRSIPRKTRSSTNKNAGPSSSCQFSPCPDTVLHDMANDAEIPTNPRLQKKRSSLKSKAGDGAPIPGAIGKGTK